MWLKQKQCVSHTECFIWLQFNILKVNTINVKKCWHSRNSGRRSRRGSACDMSPQRTPDLKQISTVSSPFILEMDRRTERSEHTEEQPLVWLRTRQEHEDYCQQHHLKSHLFLWRKRDPVPCRDNPQTSPWSVYTGNISPAERRSNENCKVCELSKITGNAVCGKTLLVGSGTKRRPLEVLTVSPTQRKDTKSLMLQNWVKQIIFASVVRLFYLSASCLLLSSFQYVLVWTRWNTDSEPVRKCKLVRRTYPTLIFKDIFKETVKGNFPT